MADTGTRLTYEDHALLPDDGQRHEIIDGLHVVSAAPVPVHQKVSRRIQFQLYRQVEEAGLGEVIDAPIDLLLSETDIVQPDAVVVLAARLSIIGPKNLQGPPDLVLEVLSDSMAPRDRGSKRNLHERAGVPDGSPTPGAASWSSSCSRTGATGRRERRAAKSYPGAFRGCAWT